MVWLVGVAAKNSETSILIDALKQLDTFIKRYSKSAHLTILLQSQADVDDKQDKRPTMKNILYVPSLAPTLFDIVMTIYRDEYYGIMQDAVGMSTENRMEIIPLKSKNSKTRGQKTMKDGSKVDIKIMANIDLSCFRIISTDD
jgi:replicative DNA helicase